MSPFPAIPRRWLILLAVMLAFLPVVIDMTILHIAVPSLTLALDASATQVLWIIDIYPLLMAGLLVPMGTLADRIGHRRVLLTGLGIFGTASLLAAFAPTPATLIATRALLALGGSMIMPCVLGIIRRTFEDEDERALALGLWGTVGAAGAALGPLIGGALLEHFWWGSAFLINVPIMLSVLPLVYVLLPRREATTPGTWTPLQALLLIAAILALVYGIKATLGQTQALTIALPVALSGLGLLVLFVRLQLRTTRPMLDLTLFSRPAILAGIIMATLASGALAGVELTLAQELQYVLGKTPLEAGIFMLPIMVAAALGGPVAGYLSQLCGLRTVAVLSLAIAAAALACLAFSDFAHPGLTVPLLLALLGLALSIGLTASSIAIMSSVAPSQGGAAGSLEATAYEFGSGLGITLFGVLLSGVYRHTLLQVPDLPSAQAERAARSIGDSYVIARDLAAPQAKALIEAAKAAFSASHSLVLMTAAALLAALALLVCHLLRGASTPRG